ncbi:MAG: M67 family metallopeptidase [Mariprofundaceae bacterium]|nr:M67 family metallopeptidase [Mariprofundaceae bacterium]
MNRFDTDAYRAVIDHGSDNRICSILSVAQETMKTSAIAGYPHEVCGLLIGTTGNQGWNISEARVLDNVNTIRAADRFELDPVAYQAIDRSLRTTGQEIVGVFHSHPDCLPRPSPTDLTHAWAMFLYPIISVVNARVVDVNYWALNDEETQFLAIQCD